MGKYAPIRTFLEKSESEIVPITFSKVENVLGFRLPNSSGYPAWWSNNPTNNVMTNEWLAAGYKTEQVDVQGRKLVFRRTVPPKVPDASGQRIEISKEPRRHPLFGWLKETVTIAPGVDLTEPADPDWGELAWGNARAEKNGGKT